MGPEKRTVLKVSNDLVAVAALIRFRAEAIIDEVSVLLILSFFERFYLVGFFRFGSSVLLILLLLRGWRTSSQM